MVATGGRDVPKNLLIFLAMLISYRLSLQDDIIRKGNRKTVQMVEVWWRRILIQLKCMWRKLHIELQTMSYAVVKAHLCVSEDIMADQNGSIEGRDEDASN